jgi:hypothetical protein
MNKRAGAALTIILGLAACYPSPDEQAAGGSTTPRYEREQGDPSLLGETVTPVRIGELGANFAACNTRGSTRNLASAQAGALPVHAGPYEAARQTDALRPGAEFFICTRSHDQRWFGIVYDEGGVASQNCGVTAPVTRRQDYEGPCAQGWVPSAFVRIVSGIDRPPAQDAGSPAPEGQGS